MTTPSDEFGLRAEAVSFGYGPEPVVKGVSLSVERGDLVALVGPNGSGKTTLLKLLSGTYRPQQGRVVLDGQDVRATAPRWVARKLAVVPQRFDARLDFTVEDLVAMGRTPHTGLFGGVSEADRQAIKRAMRATEIGSFGQRRFSDLSGGEQQRVALAMALAQETEYVLLDEPTVHLDLRHQHELLELLNTLHADRRTTVVAVLHDLNLAALYFERMCVMLEGRVIVEGPSSQIVADPFCLAAFRAPLVVVKHPQTGVPQVLLEKGKAEG